MPSSNLNIDHRPSQTQLSRGDINNGLLLIYTLSNVNTNTSNQTWIQTLPIKREYKHTLSNVNSNTPYQTTIQTHPIKREYKHTLSNNNTVKHTLSNVNTNTPYQTTIQAQPIKREYKPTRMCEPFPIKIRVQCPIITKKLLRQQNLNR